MTVSGHGRGAKDDRWPVWRLALLIYPLAAGAAAINLYMLGLMGQVFGLIAISPISAVCLGLVFGVLVAWWFGGLLRQWIDKADTRD